MNRRGIIAVCVAVVAIICGFVLQSPEVHDDMFPGAPSDSWCDTDFAKRIDINMNNIAGSALSDYQIYVNLTSNPINETSLRVYNKTDCTLRPHWTENETGGNSYGIWINYSAIAAGAWTNDTSIYYNNDTANSASNGTTTFNFFDDFSNKKAGLTTFDSIGRYDNSNPVIPCGNDGCGVGFENFTLFTEVDIPADRIQKTANHIDHAARRDEDTYLYKDYGVGHFQNFIHKIKVKPVSGVDYAISYPYVLSNDLDNWKNLTDNSKTALCIRFKIEADHLPHISILELYSGSEYGQDYTASYDTWYYIKIIKSDTSLIAYIYSDDEYYNLLGTVKVTTLQADHSFRYLFGANTYNSGNVNLLTQDIENFDICEGSADSDASIREIGNVLYEPGEASRKYKTVYTGYRLGFNFDEKIHYAYSEDGEVWTKSSAKPVISNRRAEDPYLIKIGETYYIFAEDKEAGGENRTRRWHSTDCEVWTDDGQLTGVDAQSPILIYEDTTWKLIYEHFPIAPKDVYYATSNDGLAFTDQGEVFDPLNTTWLSGGETMVPDDIRKIDSTYYMSYHAEESTNYWRSAIATSTNLTIWIDYSKNPLSAEEITNFMMFYDVENVFLHSSEDNSMGIYRGYPTLTNWEIWDGDWLADGGVMQNLLNATDNCRIYNLNHDMDSTFVFEITANVTKEVDATHGTIGLATRLNATNFWKAQINSKLNKVQIGKLEADAWSFVTEDDMTINTDQTYQLKLTNNGTIVKFYVDDVEKLNTTDAFVVGTAVYPGIFAYGAKTKTDNIKVRKYASPEPSATLGSEEDVPTTTPLISNVTNGSISSTSQYIDWDVNQTAHNRVVYDSGAVYADSTSCTGTWDVTQVCALAYDEDWATYAESTGVGTSIVTFDCAVPTGTNRSLSLWHVKDEVGEINLTIPSACWGATLYLRATSNDPANDVAWECDNGPGWTDLRSEAGGNKIYEQAMLFKHTSAWDNSTNAPNITLSGLTASTTYDFQAWSYNTTNTSLSDNSSTLDFTTASGTNPIAITSGKRALFCNWSADTTFTNIATNLTNCTDFFWYNSTSQQWIFYNINRTINANTAIPEHAAIFVHFNATTTINCEVLTAETITIPANVYYYTALRESAAKTLSQINISITGDGCTITDIYAWNSTAGAYTDTDSYSVLTNEGVAIYATTGCSWDGAV